ncbi:MAG: hypothetical protein MH208_15470 [Marinobacter sp.]|nr:hypothetical protein [Marinobacter sp.]
MQMDPQQIETIVRRVIEQLHSPQLDGERYGVFKTLDDAVAAAQNAHKKIRSMAQRQAIISAIRHSGSKARSGVVGTCGARNRLWPG